MYVPFTVAKILPPAISGRTHKGAALILVQVDLKSAFGQVNFPIAHEQSQRVYYSRAAVNTS
jgi:hypothetical protein